MEAKIYRLVDDKILGKDELSPVARPWVIEIDGKVKNNLLGKPLRYGSAKSAEESLLNFIEPCNNVEDAVQEVKPKQNGVSLSDLLAKLKTNNNS